MKRCALDELKNANWSHLESSHVRTVQKNLSHFSWSSGSKMPVIFRSALRSVVGIGGSCAVNTARLPTENQFPINFVKCMSTFLQESISVSTLPQCQVLLDGNYDKYARYTNMN